MRETIKSLLSLSWAMMLFGARQAQNLLTPGPAGAPGRRAEDAFDAVARATGGQLSQPLKELFEAGDRAQRQLIDALARIADPNQRRVGPDGRPAGPWDPAPPTAGGGSAGAARPALAPDRTAAPPAPAAATGPDDDDRPDTRTHLVLGGGLSAGMGDFALSADTQRYSYPNLLTRQMGVRFPQLLVQPPGLGAAVGFPDGGTVVPALLQSTVVETFPPALPPANLAVPGLTVADVLSLRPTPPLVHRDDAKQTAVNLLLGLPDLLTGGDEPLPTPLELALRQDPACVILELGYDDFLGPAVTGDTDRLPDVGDLCEHFTRILTRFQECGTEILLLTVPDPLDTAHFSTPAAAARFLRVRPDVLDRAYGLPPGSLITVNGLLEIAGHVLAGRFEELRPGGVLGPDAVRAVRQRVASLNDELADLARRHGAALYDLHALVRRVREQGVTVGGRRLTADYFGGFYSLNGYYPGPTGQAVIAADLLGLVGDVRRTAYPAVDVEAVLAADPVARYQAAQGAEMSWDEVVRAAPPAGPDPRPAAAASRTARPRSPADPATPPAPPALPLRLPPGGEQTLPLNPELSYHADGIRIVNCPDTAEARYGSCAGELFGGLAMFGSHLRGDLHFRFTPPAGGVSHFEIDWGDDGLAGDDSVIAAPRIFRLPAVQARVLHWPGTVLSGDLNLETGEVTNLDVRVRYVNSALQVLVQGNPNFPNVPIQFAGAYGSVAARFDQRPDGLLDFALRGTTFLPLGGDFGGDPVRWPLQFGALTGRPASVPAAGTAMHPHLHLDTGETRPAEGDAGPPDVPTNTVQEFTVHAHNSNFGDLFTLTGEELGGEARGRSHLMGRVQVQFGERFGDTVPISVATLPPGGMLLKSRGGPIADVFPGRLPAGLVGHSEFLRFPLRTYFLDSVSCIDDPFDVALGAVNVRTGEVIGELLHRGFIGQNLFFALVRVEPRTPQSSFLFRGKAAFEAGTNGQSIYRFNGVVHIPYPEGFAFPNPDLATHFPAGAASALDPFFRLQAMYGGRPPRGGMRGRADDVLASNGNRFSYRYRIPADPTRERASFEYTNRAQGGTFRMTGLAWVSFTHSRTSPAAASGCDTVTFTGYGIWSRDRPDRLHVATVQVSTARGAPYVSIQIDGGLVSNVNTKPEADEDAWA
ncbi:MAG TPA: hypothetical protein VGF55_23955 [Gemmataceae bacterium]